MSVSPQTPARRGTRHGGIDELYRIADSVTAIAGWGVAAIGVVREERLLEWIAVAGDDGARDFLESSPAPLDRFLEELEHADDWGVLKFVPHERLEPAGDEEWAWVPDVTPADCDDAWHPLDMLVAPLHDSEGRLCGMLGIDLPDDGRRPGPERRRILELYAEQAARAVVTVLEREELAEKVRLAETSRSLVREAAGQQSVERILDVAEGTLVEGFRALGLWIQTFDEDGLGRGSIYAADGMHVELPGPLVELAERTARTLWRQGRVAVVADGLEYDIITPEQGREVLDYLALLDVASILFTPLGAGEECLGNLVLTRPAKAPAWTPTETAAALEIGRDLGSAILNVRAFEREHRLVQELQELARYRSQLVATVSHELKNPLTSVLGHLEILESLDDLPRPVERSVAAMERGARRLSRVVDDLLLLARVGDPANEVVARPVDLSAIVQDVVELTAVEAERRGLEVTVVAGHDPVLAMGDADELDRVVGNLLSNAVKYTAEGGHVTLTLARCGDAVELTCTDDGIGISEDDQRELFTEFFRSSNPAAVARPGTGLGLAIVRRIVERHRGRIEVASTLGEGSTFRVVLPGA